MCIGVLVAAFALGVPGCRDVEESDSPPGEHWPAGVRSAGASPSRQLLIVAIDGLEPTLLDALIGEGKLPAFRRLVENGSAATIDCVYGASSPVVWTTVASGTAPETHGVSGFLVDDVPVTSTVRRVPAFWNILHEAGIEIATIGWMVTWPAETNGGLIVSDRAHWGTFQRKIYPPGAVSLTSHNLGELLRRAATRLGMTYGTGFLSEFTSYDYTPSYQSFPRDDSRYSINFLIRNRLVGAYFRDAAYAKIATVVLSRYRPQVLAVYFRGVDYTSHGFWKFFEPEPFLQAGWTISEEEIRHLKEVIPRYYVYVDSLLGELVRAAEPDATVIVLSDHGFGPRTDLSVPSVGEAFTGEKPAIGDFISGNHRMEAVLIFSGSAARPGVVQKRKITHADILPTILLHQGIPIPERLPGHALTEYLDEWVGSPVLVGAPAQAEPREGHQPTPSEHDEEIREQLRSLGYIE